DRRLPPTGASAPGHGPAPASVYDPDVDCSAEGGSRGSACSLPGVPPLRRAYSSDCDAVFRRQIPPARDFRRVSRPVPSSGRGIGRRRAGSADPVLVSEARLPASPTGRALAARGVRGGEVASLAAVAGRHGPQPAGPNDAAGVAWPLPTARGESLACGGFQ